MSKTLNQKLAVKKEKREKKEKTTIKIMIGIYCKAHHHLDSMEECSECGGLYEYALQRLEHCPHVVDKPTCASCKIHCYKPEKREHIRKVMRYAGPRMIWTHPILALGHLRDVLKKT